MKDVQTVLCKYKNCENKTRQKYNLISYYSSSGLPFFKKIQNYILCKSQFVSTFTISI